MMNNTTNNSNQVPENEKMDIIVTGALNDLNEYLDNEIRDLIEEKASGLSTIADILESNIGLDGKILSDQSLGALDDSSKDLNDDIRDSVEEKAGEPSTIADIVGSNIGVEDKILSGQSFLEIIKGDLIKGIGDVKSSLLEILFLCQNLKTPDINVDPLLEINLKFQKKVRSFQLINQEFSKMEMQLEEKVRFLPEFLELKMDVSSFVNEVVEVDENVDNAIKNFSSFKKFSKLLGGEKNSNKRFDAQVRKNLSRLLGEISKEGKNLDEITKSIESLQFDVEATILEKKLSDSFVNYTEEHDSSVRTEEMSNGFRAFFKKIIGKIKSSVKRNAESAKIGQTTWFIDSLMNEEVIQDISRVDENKDNLVNNDKFPKANVVSTVFVEPSTANKIDRSFGNPFEDLEDTVLPEEAGEALTKSLEKIKLPVRKRIIKGLKTISASVNNFVKGASSIVPNLVEKITHKNAKIAEAKLRDFSKDIITDESNTLLNLVKALHNKNAKNFFFGNMVDDASSEEMTESSAKILNMLDEEFGRIIHEMERVKISVNHSEISQDEALTEIFNGMILVKELNDDFVSSLVRLDKKNPEDIKLMQRYASNPTLIRDLLHKSAKELGLTKSKSAIVSGLGLNIYEHIDFSIGSNFIHDELLSEVDAFLDLGFKAVESKDRKDRSNLKEKVRELIEKVILRSSEFEPGSSELRIEKVILRSSEFEPGSSELKIVEQFHKEFMKEFDKISDKSSKEEKESHIRVMGCMFYGLINIFTQVKGLPKEYSTLMFRYKENPKLINEFSTRAIEQSKDRLIIDRDVEGFMIDSSLFEMNVLRKFKMSKTDGNNSLHPWKIVNGLTDLLNKMKAMKDLKLDKRELKKEIHNGIVIMNAMVKELNSLNLENDKSGEALLANCFDKVIQKLENQRILKVDVVGVNLVPTKNDLLIESFRDKFKAFKKVKSAPVVDSASRQDDTVVRPKSITFGTESANRDTQEVSTLINENVLSVESFEKVDSAHAVDFVSRQDDAVANLENITPNTESVRVDTQKTSDKEQQEAEKGAAKEVSTLITENALSVKSFEKADSAPVVDFVSRQDDVVANPENVTPNVESVSVGIQKTSDKGQQEAEKGAAKNSNEPATERKSVAELKEILISKIVENKAPDIDKFASKNPRKMTNVEKLGVRDGKASTEKEASAQEKVLINTESVSIGTQKVSDSVHIESAPVVGSTPHPHQGDKVANPENVTPNAESVSVDIQKTSGKEQQEAEKGAAKNSNEPVTERKSVAELTKFFVNKTGENKVSDIGKFASKNPRKMTNVEKLGVQGGNVSTEKGASYKEKILKSRENSGKGSENAR